MTQQFDFGRVTVRKRARLPHWDVQHGIYFLTFGLFDAMPRAVRQQIRDEADAQLETIRALRGEPTLAEQRAVEQWVQAKLGETLDHSYGACFLRDRNIAEIVGNAITHFDEQRYDLLAWCVMPNHVHVVLSVREGHRIDAVVHSWKSFSSKACNRALGRTGAFWADDYFDRNIRDARELHDTIEYVVCNPEAAGLRRWQHVASFPERIGGASG